tara:strand:+ start:963 stop:1802 length:840 start_codon:yes stop_codon:yes gene_type:complete
MALELGINISLSTNGKTMTFTETTGAYNVNLNPKGWGSPNALLTDISEASLVVTLPDTTSKTLFYTKGQYNGGAFSPNFPDSTETYTFDITKALNSKFSLNTISGSGTQVTYTTYTSHNFTTSSLLTTTGSSITGYNITSTLPFSVTSNTFVIDLNTTTGTPTLTNPLAYTSDITTEAFDDGIYKFVYTAVNPVAKTSYTDTFYLLVTTAVACCVDKLFHLASQSDCSDCKSEKLNKALEAESYLKAAEYAAACGKVNMATKHLAKAQWICSEQNCLNC